MTLGIYLPQDRYRALATATDLPTRTSGTALFADISGFTALTERLTRTLGLRRGIDTFTLQLNSVYSVLIATVERYGGSVIGFAGDSITCWFDDRPGGAAHAAAGCALALQAAMGQFARLPLPEGEAASLALKVALGTGGALRLVVGDPAVQLLDLLAGPPVQRMAAGEQLAAPGEVLVDAPTAAALGADAALGGWRADAAGERFAPLLGLPAPPLPPASPVEALPAELLRPWLLPAVFERHQAGLGEFLTDLRPAVALFLGFDGIDYEGDAAALDQLGQLVRRLQAIVTGYGGTLLQITIGDKGSYAYAAFGAPVAHEDDARRALLAALDLHTLPRELPFLRPPRVGVTRGTMRTGAYGGATRQTYGVLGDDVNLAARLMDRAAPGQTLTTAELRDALERSFAWEAVGAVQVKGKAEPVALVAVRGAARTPGIRLQEPRYLLPMVGRAAEVAQVGALLRLALGGRGQIVGITGEAGVGKSRLVATCIGLAQERGMDGLGGECQSYGTSSPYLVWQPILRGLFDLDPQAPPERQAAALADAVGRLAPARSEALPLLARALDLPVADTALTAALDRQGRKTALEALVIDCLRAAAQARAGEGRGLLIVLEDLHWIDPLSHDLLALAARVIAGLPVLVVLAYRPPDLARLAAPRVEALSHFTGIALDALEERAVAELVDLKCEQLGLGLAADDRAALRKALAQRSQGNPFYIEELLSYVRGRLLPGQPLSLGALALPPSLHSLVLSRIDQLSERQQATLKVASVIGRLFRVAWLHGFYPMLGDLAGLRSDLDTLARLELTPLDATEPELTYLFKHVVTQEVAYESLAETVRASLHEQLGVYLEGLGSDSLLDLLAFHYDRSGNLAKRRLYLRRAGEAAAARYDNVTADDYLSRALAIAEDDGERYRLLLAREAVLDLLGARERQREDLHALATLASRSGDAARQAHVALRRAALGQSTGAYTEALHDAQQASALAETAGATALVAEGLLSQATTHRLQGAFPEARQILERTLTLARAAGATALEAQCLRLLGNIADLTGGIALARSHLEQAHAIFVALGDRRGEATTLSNLGVNAWRRSAYREGVAFLQRGLAIARALGDLSSQSVLLTNLGLVLGDSMQIGEAQLALEEALGLHRLLGNPSGVSRVLMVLTGFAKNRGDFRAALASAEEILELLSAIGDRDGEATARFQLGDVWRLLGDTERAQGYLEQTIVLGRAIDNERWVEAPLSVMVLLDLARGDAQAALARAEESLASAQRLGAVHREAAARIGYGHALAAVGRAAEASAQYREAFDLATSDAELDMAAEAQAGLARLALARGDLAEAVALAEQILAQLNLDYVPIDAAPEPMRSYLTCYHVLAAAADPRADELLAAAATHVQRCAAQLDDPAIRERYLAAPLNREALTLWERRPS